MVALRVVKQKQSECRMQSNTHVRVDRNELLEWSSRLLVLDRLGSG
jgi:hypothetical protein